MDASRFLLLVKVATTGKRQWFSVDTLLSAIAEPEASVLARRGMDCLEDSLQLVDDMTGAAKGYGEDDLSRSFMAVGVKLTEAVRLAKEAKKQKKVSTEALPLFGKPAEKELGDGG